LPTPIIETTPKPSLKDVAGLIYKLENELWFIDENGDKQFLFALPQDAFTFDIQFSKSLIKILYEHEGDIWFVDLETQEQRNITNTAERVEKAPRFWTGRSDVIIFESLPLTEFSFLRLAGVLTTINLDRSNYKILNENSNPDFLLSPNGEKIMYQFPNGVIEIYDWRNETKENIDINLYQLPLGRHEEIFIQAWSPDERYLASWIKRYLNYSENYQIGIEIIDLQTKTSQPLHLISPPKAGGDVIHYISWSLDGEWMVFTVYLDPVYPDEYISLWLLQIATEKEIHIDEGVNPIWHEESQRLAYDRKAKALIDGIWIYDLKTYSNYKTSLPDEAILVDWVSLENFK
jgi:WD40 repeat protein